MPEITYSEVICRVLVSNADPCQKHSSVYIARDRLQEKGCGMVHGPNQSMGLNFQRHYLLLHIAPNWTFRNNVYPSEHPCR